jgi:hypothetical protein
MDEKVESEQKREGRFDYDWTAFFMKEPGDDRIAKGPFRAKDRAGHRQLIEQAKELQLYLWYARVVKQGEKYRAIAPFIVDFETVPDFPYGSPEQKKIEAAGPAKKEPKGDVLLCPVCKKECTSSSGLTLHMKSQHPAADVATEQ